jgi:hypothetical protein
VNARADWLGEPPEAEPKPPPAFWLDASGWAEASIPCRPWLVPRYLLRGSVSLLIGPPGVSKSLLALTWCSALALGFAHGDFAPLAQSRAAILNAEDDQNEQRRRLSAGLRQFGATPDDLGDRLMRMGALGIATLMAKPRDGGFILTDAYHELSRLVIEHKIDALILDPMAELHEADENANGELRHFVAELRALAVEHKIAILLVHHTRKGAVSPGDMDAARGASALIGAVRAAWTLTAMSESEAESFNIPKDRRSYFARLDDAKANFGPFGAPRWYEKTVLQIANDEMVPALIPWKAPVPRAASVEDCAAMLAEIERGVDGEPYSPRVARQKRSIRALLQRHGFTASAHETISVLLDAGAEIANFRTAGRKIAQGLRHNGLPAAEWLDEAGGASRACAS